MHSEVDPPPVIREGKLRPRFRFNTATLLGAMALVAVVCVLAMTVPELFAIALSLLASGVIVAYASALTAGTFVTRGSRQLFAIGAAVALVISMWGMPTSNITVYWLDNRGLSPLLATLVWAVVSPLKHIVLSLLGGWVALKTARYWRTDNP